MPTGQRKNAARFMRVFSRCQAKGKSIRERGEKISGPFFRRHKGPDSFLVRDSNRVTVVADGQLGQRGHIHRVGPEADSAVAEEHVDPARVRRGEGDVGAQVGANPDSRAAVAAATDAAIAWLPAAP